MSVGREFCGLLGHSRLASMLSGYVFASFHHRNPGLITLPVSQEVSKPPGSKKQKYCAGADLNPKKSYFSM